MGSSNWTHWVKKKQKRGHEVRREMDGILRKKYIYYRKITTRGNFVVVVLFSPRRVAGECV